MARRGKRAPPLDTRSTERARRRQFERKQPAASLWPPRALWLGLHAAALGMLGLSGGWPASGTAWSWVHTILLSLTVALYASASLRDPGYADLSPDPDASSQQALHFELGSSPR